ncbi:MAG: hypothetical protein ETSY2_22945 [Candidatus Entotheonella gemina]|uniref:Glycosyl transferase family 1 domain-containing protein n=1 Tax=Candidatus Entotheonella gemina TaxID=1429439 RepID=W4M694_9BACT|nr:MAG: hypothetical protein ETSY2_22945 [Candidatus Entotheonella gemina]
MRFRSQPYRLGILASHPIQYHSPWFRHLAQHLDIDVWYAHRSTAQDQAAAGFGVGFDWDIPLLQGYPHRWLHNVAAQPSLQTFRGCDTPDVYRLCRRDRLDAVLVFGWQHKSALQAIRACWRQRLPVLMRGDSHLLTARSRLKTLLKYAPYRWLLPRLSGHLYVGSRNKAYLEHYGVPPQRLFFAPHCVDNAYWAAAAERAERQGAPAKLRAQWGIPPDGFVCLFAGKMIAHKRAEHVIQACTHLLQAPAGTGLYVICVGDGPLRPQLEHLARPQDKRIFFAGFQNQRALPTFYRAADVLILPSREQETWGLVVNEAAACGTPAIVCDAAGCAPDLIDEGDTGYTYPFGDIRALAERIVALRSAWRHRKALIRRALAAKISRYSIEQATTGLIHALDAVQKER